MPPKSDANVAKKKGLAAFKLMAARNVPVTPKNYQIWYAFVSQDNPPLTKALNEILNSGIEITPELSDEIYTTFFKDSGNIADSMIEVGERMQSELSVILQEVGAVSGTTSNYGAHLADASGHLLNADAGPTFKTVIDNLLGATKQMMERTAVLETQLENSTREITNLQETLQAIREESLTDPLTGVSNRKAFDTALITAIKDANESQKPLSLLFCDVDNFKQFNDKWGHQTGDKVLRLVGSLIKQNVKGQDTAARYGGEEFAIILPNTKLDNARKVAEVIRGEVEQKKLQRKNSGESLGKITISLGVALYQPGEARSDFIQRADACLYAAKGAGRNCTVAETDEAAAPVLDQKGAA